jgi:hypothetical protein
MPGNIRPSTLPLPDRKAWNGYPEETYYTFSYSPIPNDDGTGGGIFCANSDDTQRVIGERQLALLRELAAEAGQARNWQEDCEQGAASFAANPHDLPFAMIYMAEPEVGRSVAHEIYLDALL